MKEVVRKISLDLSRKTNKRYIFASQTDYNSRVFIFSICDDGVPYFVEKSVTASVNIMRSDGTSWTYLTDVTDDGRVYFVASLWTFEVPGETQLTVTLYDGESRITTAPFIIDVAEDLMGEDQTGEVAENLSLFQQAMDDFAAINEKEEERCQNETARVQEEQWRIEQEYNRMNAEKARNDSEQIRESNELARSEITDMLFQTVDNLLTLQQIYIENVIIPV